MRRAWTCAEALRGGCRERLLDLFATVDRRLAREPRHPRSSRSKRALCTARQRTTSVGSCRTEWLSRFGGKTTSAAPRTTFLRFATGAGRRSRCLVRVARVAAQGGLRFYVFRRGCAGGRGYVSTFRGDVAATRRSRSWTSSGGGWGIPSRGSCSGPSGLCSFVATGPNVSAACPG